MEKYKKVYNSITKVAFGYFFLYIDINIGIVSITPAFVGYFLFLLAIGSLKEEEREFSLLKPLCIILLVLNIFTYFSNFVGVNIAFTVVDLILTAISLYFNYQFLTNLSYIAAKYQKYGASSDAKFLKYRTVQTVVLTVIGIFKIFSFFYSDLLAYVSIVFALVSAVMCILIIVTLFKLRKNLDECMF